MKKNLLTSLIVMLLILPVKPVLAKTQVVALKTEYRVNPLGLDVLKPRFSWQLVSDKNNILQTAYEIEMATTPEKLAGKKDLLWSTSKTLSAQSVNIVYEGPSLASMQRIYWRVRVWDNSGKASDWSPSAWFETGILNTEAWKASWITVPKEQGTLGKQPCPYFRKTFTNSKPVKSARIYVTSLGTYQLFLNGKKVSNDLFAPGWTSYKKRLQYQTYDVSGLLGKSNTLGAIVGDGWYRGRFAWKDAGKLYGDKTALLLQLEIQYTDGSRETISTDGDWKYAFGAIRESGIYDGEVLDNRMELKGWADNTYDDKSWQKVSLLDYGKNTLVGSDSDPVQAVEEIKPIAVIKTPKGETVLDMGQNMVGWIRMKVIGKSGDSITLRFAEILDKDQNFYTENLRSAKATDLFVLKGKEEEVFEPHFTFHGFRYVQVIGYPGELKPTDFTGVVIHTAMVPTGSFSCSDSLLTQLQHNIQWGQKGNFLDVPTDCPQRDERLGWTGDAQVFSMTAAYNFDVAPFYTKWLKDLAVDQQPDGSVPHVIPDVLNGAGGSTAWADVSVVIPWTMYRIYGDTRILEQQYASMQAWIGFMQKTAGEDYLWKESFHFGDWLAFATTNSDYPGATTEKDLIATAYYSYSTRLLSKMAAILGKTEDAKTYEDLANKVKAAFIAEYVTPNGRLVSHTQTAYALALSFDLLPENLKARAAQYLAEDVEKFGHLTTGFVGTPLLCNTLAAIGREDLAFKLLTRKDYPSWLYPITKGATTIWERWDGIKPDGSLQDIGMNSYNHYAYGAIGEWMYRHIAGLGYDIAVPGYKHSVLAPHPGGGLTQAKASFNSMYGKIESSWKTAGGNMLYQFTIPANTSATVILPGAASKNITLNGAPLNTALIKPEPADKKDVSLELGSGSYTIQYPYEVK